MVPSILQRAKAALAAGNDEPSNRERATVELDTKLLQQVRPYTLASVKKLGNLKRLASSTTARGIAGDFVECGTYKGGSAAVLGSALGPERHLWLYDSFEGMPEVKAVDGTDANEWVGKLRASDEDVKEVLTSVGLSPNQYTIRKGWFDQTFLQPLPERVALLHCDADWHASVTVVLETFYPRVAEGGVVVLDDFGWWEGCREAFYDFCARHGEKPLLERMDCDQAYWIKGKTNNRTGQD
ncbi:MAG: TylF/MycF family methyltransferase [Acidobacteriota bacterium]|nr:TylF/MycF family methyltransferase [Acidobacteriota bacterium]